MHAGMAESGWSNHCVLYCTILDWTVLYWTVLDCTALYWTVLYCTILDWTVLHCTVLDWTVLYCTVLDCTVLHFTGHYAMYFLRGRNNTWAFSLSYKIEENRNTIK